MSWKKIIGLEREKQILQKTLLEKRLANAYCFLGIEGIGKDAIALELAKTANCYNPIIDLSKQEISACDNCKSCKMANSFSHPNIKYVFALPSGEKLNDEQFATVKEQIALKNANKYHKINIPNANQIHISIIRKIKKEAALTSFNKGKNFIIISNCDTMNSEAANAFLKTLEEPQLNTTVIITSSKKEKLLQTILSRCQQIYFNPISSENIVKYLVSEYEKSEIESKLIATFAQGSITKAVESFDDNMNILRSETVDILRIALKRKFYRIELINAIEKILEMKDKKKYVLILNLLLIWLRDVHTVAILKKSDLIINTDLQERIIKFHEGFSNANILQAINFVEKSINYIEYNVDSKMVFISLFIELRKIFLGIDY